MHGQSWENGQCGAMWRVELKAKSEEMESEPGVSLAWLLGKLASSPGSITLSAFLSAKYN